MRSSTIIGVVILIAGCGQGAINSGDPGHSAADSGLPPLWSDSAPAGPEVCGDGLDNDGNGQVDESCACDPAATPTQACYPGPATTRNVGICKDGQQSCQASGEFSAWGACSGAVTPGTEDCSDGLDNDCNGAVDDGPGCACKPGETRTCYSGPAATQDVGECSSGTQTCNAAGTAWDTTCTGEALPAAEQCGDNKDNDCDGLVDEGCTATHAPQGCTVATMTHIVGTKDCAPHSAVYMIDDGMGPNMICCPLPATDILTTTVSVRGAACNPDEVITGAISPLTFKCTRINTQRYKLAAAQKPCYFGSGWSGGSGVPKCQAHPATFTTLQNNSFGSDGCSGYPYGALFTQQIGKYCSEMLTRQLQYTGAVKGDPAAGTPVVMFK